MTFKLLNPFGEEYMGNYLYQLTLMIFALALITTVGYQIKYRNKVELCEWKNGLGDNRVEKVCREVLIEKK